MSATARRVLVVDDNADSAEMLALLLTRHGHRAEVADDGPSALEVFERFRPDVALVDIGLPSIDGHELARELDRRARGHLLLVAVTGHPEDGRNTSFAHYLLKPVATRTLLAVIEI
jgi:CheY-like chemotaxis protein